MRLIDADKVFNSIAEQEQWNVPDFVYDALKDASTVEAIPKELYEQIQWERDIALSQLKQLNIELGEKPYHKAIPVEWVEQWITTNCYDENGRYNGEGYDTVEDMLKDWKEKCNNDRKADK